MEGMSGKGDGISTVSTANFSRSGKKPPGNAKPCGKLLKRIRRFFNPAFYFSGYFVGIDKVSMGLPTGEATGRTGRNGCRDRSSPIGLPSNRVCTLPNDLSKVLDSSLLEHRARF
jgi:hypothetical protein